MVLCMIFAAVTGCEKASDQTDRPMFAFVIDISGRFWQIANAGCQQAGREENVDVEFHVPGQSTAAQQKQIIETLLAKGCDGIAICPLSPESLTKLLDQASDYMLVICQGADAPDSKRICYIGTDNVAAGRMAGEKLKEALPQGGQVAIFTATLDLSNQRERRQGVIDALKDSNCEIVGTFSDQADRNRAQSNVRTVLSKYPDLKGIVGVAGYNAPSAAKVLQDYPDNQITLVGFDEDVETIEAIRRGEIYCSIAQQPYVFGYESMKMLARIYRGEEVNIPDNKLIYIPVIVVDKNNAEEICRDSEEKLSTLEVHIKTF